MRTTPHIAASAVVATAALLGVWRVTAPPSARSTAPRVLAQSTADATATSGTPIVDPLPTPGPRHFPVAFVHFDAHAPEPLTGRARGTLLPLAEAGRRACAPATHLLAKDDTLPPVGVALAYQLDPANPATVLDLYFGSFVEIRGTESLPPAGCSLATKTIGVMAVEVLDTPGARQPR